MQGRIFGSETDTDSDVWRQASKRTAIIHGSDSDSDLDSDLDTESNTERVRKAMNIMNKRNKFVDSEENDIFDMRSESESDSEGYMKRPTKKNVKYN